MRNRRFTTKRFALLVLILHVSVVLAPAVEQSDVKHSKSPDQASPAELNELDAQVLNVVLNDMLTYSGGDSPVLDQGQAPKLVWFSPKTVVVKQNLESLLYKQEKERWEKLTDAQRNAVEPAANNLIHRVNTVESFTGVRSKNNRLRVAEKPEAAVGSLSIRDARTRPIQAWAPGYTEDQRFAMVRLVIPWSMHHAEGTFLLSNDGKAWTICLRQFVYYV